MSKSTKIAKINKKVFKNEDEVLFYNRRGGPGYFSPFAALRGGDREFCKRWWDRWFKRPESGKAKVWRGDYGNTPPHP